MFIKDLFSYLLTIGENSHKLLMMTLRGNLNWGEKNKTTNQKVFICQERGAVTWIWMKQFQQKQ